MLNNFILSCESTVDMPYGYIAARGISVLFYKYEINGEIFEDDMCRTENSINDFYKKLQQGAVPKTSQINIKEYIDYFENIIKKGDVLHITFGTGMTSGYQNACIAASQIKLKYPDRNIVVTDSLCSCCGYGMLVNCAADLKDKGKDMETVANWVIDNRQNIQHRFFATDMKYFKRSGRVKGSAAAIATVLSICPIMKLDGDGKMVAYGKIRGKKNAIKSLVQVMKETARDKENYDGKCYISHSVCFDDALLLKEMIEKEFKKLEKVEIFSIGTVIGCHSGPGTVALYYFGDKRE